MKEPHCVGSCKWTLSNKGERCLVCGVKSLEELKNKKCENCGVKLFNSFSNSWHNPKECNKKTITALSPDCA